jgi:hypothetical protein
LLLEETGGEVLRWAAIAGVAKRLGIDEREAILLAGECAEADYVRLDVKGDRVQRYVTIDAADIGGSPKCPSMQLEIFSPQEGP